MGFFEKFFELQTKMLIQNNQLTAPHPYQSRPFSWPLMLRGISYWTKDEINGQIYMTGNVAGWWTGLLSVFVFCTISLVDSILRRRQIYLVKESKLGGGFFFFLCV